MSQNGEPYRLCVRIERYDVRKRTLATRQIERIAQLVLSQPVIELITVRFILWNAIFTTRNMMYIFFGVAVTEIHARSFVNVLEINSYLERYLYSVSRSSIWLCGRLKPLNEALELSVTYWLEWGFLYTPARKSWFDRGVEKRRKLSYAGDG